MFPKRHLWGRRGFPRRGWGVLSDRAEPGEEGGPSEASPGEGTSWESPNHTRGPWVLPTIPLPFAKTSSAGQRREDRCLSAASLSQAPTPPPLRPLSLLGSTAPGQPRHPAPVWTLAGRELSGNANGARDHFHPARGDTDVPQARICAAGQGPEAERSSETVLPKASARDTEKQKILSRQMVSSSLIFIAKKS